jgi:AraC-like DNA-binding protein
MKIFIKNMVSLRCKLAVKDVLRQLGLHFIVVELGEVDVMEELTAAQRQQIADSLLPYGLELMSDKKNMLIEKIKNTIIEMVHYAGEPPKIKFSDYLSEKLGQEYHYLSNLFSEVQGTTIEHFIIAHKIERAKEFLIYDDLTLTQISYKLNYSSVAHLSNQFKKVTGLTPSHFKALKDKRRTALENVGDAVTETAIPPKA